MKVTLQNWIKQSLEKIISDKDFLSSLSIPIQTSFQIGRGDYSTPLPFALKDVLKKEPKEIAQLLKQELENSPLPIIEKIEIAQQGYLNFFIKKPALIKELNDIYLHYDAFLKKASSPLNKNKVVIVEYSSPNIAKPMHIGHLRSTIIGAALANLYQALGYKVIRWNYIGDWGTQFGKLIAAYKLWGNKKEVETDPLPALLSLYQRFHEEAKKDPSLEKKGQEEFRKLEEGDEENRKLWLWFKEESLREFNKLYNLLGIKFDVVKGESDLEKDLLPLLQELSQKKLVRKSQGALIFPLEQFHLPPALLQKSDEATLYLTRDLASLIYRLKIYNPQKILYVVANEQSLYFQQLFAIAEILKLNIKTELIHTKFGLVLDQDGKKFSTREGKLVPLQEVIEKGIARALLIVKEKNPSWSLQKQKDIAQTIALDALKFNDLKEHRLMDVVFAWDKMLALKGNSSVYLQYTYARLYKILTKAGKIKGKDCATLNKPIEIALIKKLLDFPDVIKQSAVNYSPNQLATYLLSLSDWSNRYYEEVPILKEEDMQQREARLILIKCITNILEKGLNILGLTALPEI